MQLRYGLEEYAHFSLETLSAGLDTVHTHTFEVKEDTLTNREYAQIQIKGQNLHTAEVQEIYYNIGVIETPRYFHQFIAWSTPAHMETLQAAMPKVFSSFQEIPSEPLYVQEVPQPQR